MRINGIRKYLVSAVRTPYFLFVSDRKYAAVIEDLSAIGLAFIKVSNYCNDNDDKLPDIDCLLEHLETIDVNIKDKKLVVLGLGEYLGLRGSVVAESILSCLKDLNVGGAKVILLLRGLSSQISELQVDPRFDNRRYSIVDNAECNLSFTHASQAVGLSMLMGFKDMLSKLENGVYGNVIVNTVVNLENALFTIHKISNAYEGIKFIISSLKLPRSCGSDAQWSELLSELNQNNNSLDEIFEKYSYSVKLEADFFSRIAGSDFVNWLYFIALKQKRSLLENSYLQFVVDKTSCFIDFKLNVINMIIDVPHTDECFAVYYAERKALVEKFPESDIADFVINNRKNPTESVYKLTDGTKTEREEIIAWVSKNGLIPQISKIYPALEAYLNQYVFNCGELSSLFTDYFDDYKQQKILNTLEINFLTKVDELAIDRKYNRLPTRSEVVDNMDKTDTYLFWLDALGVEYLAYIAELVSKHGLSISVSITRAELPTLTSINRDFYDNWEGRKEKNCELDEIKHKAAGGYNFANNELPIHLAKELEIIAMVIDRAATALTSRHYKRFLIVSDHGASRLAVLRRKEEKYQTDTRGEHSGRCCEKFEPYDLPFAAEENDYLVLADYGRFIGSRAANVEVHGGASLEEVVVPVIELKLKNRNVIVKIVEESVTVDFRAGTAVTLFANTSLNNITIVLNGKRYSAVQTDMNHYKILLPDIKRAGDYPAEVYSGDDLINRVLIKAQGKSGKVNDAFDDLF